LELEVDILAAMGEMLQQTDRMVELHLVGVLVGVVHLEGQAAMVARGSL
jgi:hypothetical protein